MVADLGITLPTAAVVIAIIIVLGYLASVRMKTRHEDKQNKPVDPLLRVIVLVMLFVLLMATLFFFELTTWNPIDHPGMITLIAVGLYILTWYQLRRLKEKTFNELDSIARPFLVNHGATFPKNLPYLEMIVFKRINKKGNMIGYFIYQITSVQKGVDKVLIGLDVYSGQIIDWVFDPSVALVDSLKDEDITIPSDIYRDMTERKIKTPEEQLPEQSPEQNAK